MFAAFQTGVMWRGASFGQVIDSTRLRSTGSLKTARNFGCLRSTPSIMTGEHSTMLQCLALVVVLGAGCTRANPARSCADGDCSDPNFPFCDVDGVLGDEPLTCVAASCTPNEVLGCREELALLQRERRWSRCDRVRRRCLRGWCGSSLSVHRTSLCS